MYSGECVLIYSHSQKGESIDEELLFAITLILFFFTRSYNITINQVVHDPVATLRNYSMIVKLVRSDTCTSRTHPIHEYVIDDDDKWK